MGKKTRKDVKPTEPAEASTKKKQIKDLGIPKQDASRVRSGKVNPNDFSFTKG